MDYFNSSTLSSLLGESTTTEKSNSDILNDTIQTFHKVITSKDMVSHKQLHGAAFNHLTGYFPLFQPQLCFALLLTYLWIIYITFYNSRIIGYLVTKFVNKLFFKTAYFKIGLCDKLLETSENKLTH